MQEIELVFYNLIFIKGGLIMKRIIRLLLFFLCTFFIGQTSECSKHEERILDGASFGCDQAHVRVIERFKTLHHTHIAILENKKDGNKFIVKQDTRDVLFRHLAVARDKLGAFVAESIGVSANRVEIIPAYCAFPGKKYFELPATLHTFVPGVMVKFLPKELKMSIYIQQSIGLTDTILTTMIAHQGLCDIVALDTFIANADRHRGNFFYDQESRRFYAIDLESSFDKNLAIYSCKFIKAMLNTENIQIEPPVLVVLKKYQKTLKKLIKQHTPESLCEKLVEYAAQGGIFMRSAQSAVRDRLNSHKEAIEKNYNSCKKLTRLLDKLISKYSSKKQ